MTNSFIGTRLFQVAAFLVVGCATGMAQTKYFTNWNEGTSPEEVGKRVAEHFVATPSPASPIGYPEICAWYGALTFADVTKNLVLRADLIHRYDPLLDPANASHISLKHHVDFSIFGALPLEIFQETKQKQYLFAGLPFADRQFETTTPDGLSTESRFWIDDMYMLTILQVQAYRATGDRKYIDRAALEMAAYLDKLQRPNGLFFHAPDVPFFWGRGDGWVAAGMAELLRSLPADNVHRARILEGYRSMMKALLQYQGSDGMWRELIDHPEAWPETSSTGMFTFALVTGVKNGWLDEATYGPAARKAWLALVGYVDQNADVTSVCEGTDKENSLQHYLQRRRRTGDLHGQAPLLWAATALLRP